MNRNHVAVLTLTLIGFLFPLTVSAYPTARTGASFAYNKELKKAILFGGRTQPDASRVRYTLSDTWEWNGIRWIRHYPAKSPAARFGAPMVYDSVRSRLVLFGGADADKRFDDAWTYNGTAWTEIVTTVRPSARRDAAAAFDFRRDRIVLFGGFDGTASLFDTWEFNGSSWFLANGAGPKLTNPSLAYDEVREQTVMLGVNEKNETEMYRWLSSSWEKLTPAHLPPCVNQGSMVYQNHNDKILFVGASCPDGSIEDDTQEWDGTDWTNVEAKPAAPFILGYSIAYDVERGNTVLFGGNDQRDKNATLLYRDGVWTEVVDEFAPGPRSLFVFEGDEQRGVVWLYGGQNERGSLYDLWKLEDNRWSRIKAEGEPSACSYPVGAFDSDRGRLVILCEDSSTFEWDGTAWFKFDNLTRKPPSRRFSHMTYDEKNKRSVMFGGYGSEGSTRSGNFSDYLKETWTWNGQAWTKNEKKTTPTARMLAAFFFDPVSQKTYLFGGIGRKSAEDRITRFSDMWSFDGTNWTKLKITGGPASRYGAQTGYNRSTSKTVMFGGKSDKEEFLNEHWEWNGTAWQKVDVRNPPSPRMNGRIDFDPSTNEMTLYGGYRGEYFSDIWKLDANQWTLIPEVVE
ncbi:MAG TPA: kelch repeat-containing protein [Thermoanaerobaculia bacterium]|nr:kelch repeat-containing protein [Thermoanaerobaculia bacterium]